MRQKMIGRAFEQYARRRSLSAVEVAPHRASQHQQCKRVGSALAIGIEVPASEQFLRLLQVRFVR